MSKLSDPLIQQSIKQFKDYVALPSVSAKKQAQPETA